LESGGVKEEFRRQGIATKLISAAEGMARQKGFTQIGMAVGADDNPKARHLYESLGYKEWPHGLFEESWLITGANGNEILEKEICTYLGKSLK
jgi:predicted GNAT family acetyltransferase